MSGFESEDLSKLTVDKFVLKLNEKYKLELTSEQCQNAAKVLNDQWFTYAIELEHAEIADFQYLDIPSSLSGAIFSVFHPSKTNPFPATSTPATVVAPSTPKSRSSSPSPRPVSPTPSEEIGRAVQQECRDRSRMPSSA
eukprot:TRINITY_DN51118_c0_g1_i2.p1 TRINITY_DN51118_c0_g1~~TRINITY_DN51118_c0_g1_i2.p1  ORF type:complete len:139 (+),score=23.02 TRINITY_DN51118_c0_g1_i2:124-540(+)